jgi:cation diffusion facilitator CzcD-associated flavoprotein CzcO
VCHVDIPAHTYQATFEPNKEWSTFYARALEIHQYWKRVAEKYGCMKYIKLKQQISEAVWDEEHSKWNLQVIGLSLDASLNADLISRSKMSIARPHIQIGVIF